MFELPTHILRITEVMVENTDRNGAEHVTKIKVQRPNLCLLKVWWQPSLDFVTKLAYSVSMLAKLAYFACMLAKVTTEAEKWHRYKKKSRHM
jgi:hypothetical protein